MLSITLQDLKFRRRRFAIAIIGVALVFAMALVMSGMSAGFRVEARRVVSTVDADAWLVPEGVAGPFTAFGTIDAAVADEVAREQGVTRADPLIILRHTVERDGAHQDVNVLGYRSDGHGEPELSSGRLPGRPGEAVVDGSVGVGVGDEFVMQDRTFTAVGRTSGFTYLGGIPVVMLTLSDAQELAFNGRPLANTVVVSGGLERPPPGFTLLGNDDVRADLLRPLANGVEAIDSVRILLWVVAAIIIGALIYLSALERVGDFAVLKAVGATSASLFAGLAVQAVIVSLLAAALGSLLGLLLAPTFALPIRIPASAFALLPAVALAVGALASLTGLRRAVHVDPALAFGGAQ